MTHDTDGILRANLSRLISPSQVVGIDHVSTFGLNHEWFCSIREHKVLRLCIQCPFISCNRQFFPLPSKECDCDGLEYRLLVPLKNPSLLRLHLPLDRIALRVRKHKL
jgi:hypothetical protein